MAQYKVIQDIEAEDKLVGPLTLRQFIYALIAGASLFICYFVTSRGAVFLLPFFLVPALIAIFFAFPWGRDQSTEIWALARIRFLFFPRRRIWDQSGQKNLVTVNVPKRPAQMYTDGLSQVEVRSRLHALATTIDSRGWALKDSVLFGGAPVVSDRLVTADNAPREVPTIGAEVYEDMLDAGQGVGQKFDSLLNANANAARQKLTATMTNPDPVAGQPEDRPDYWFLSQTSPEALPDDGSAVFRDQVVHPGDAGGVAIPDDAQEQALEAIITDPAHHFGGLQQIDPNFGHVTVIKPLADQEKEHIAQARAKAKAEAAAQLAAVERAHEEDNEPEVEPAINTLPKNLAKPEPEPTPVAAAKQKEATTAAKPTPEQPVTAAPSAAILNLSRNNDRSIDSLAREAKESNPTEVTISLR